MRIKIYFNKTCWKRKILSFKTNAFKESMKLSQIMTQMIQKWKRKIRVSKWKYQSRPLPSNKKCHNLMNTLLRMFRDHILQRLSQVTIMKIATSNMLDTKLKLIVCNLSMEW